MTKNPSEFSCLCARVGFSQQDAAKQFNVRLDTVKKWQQGKMLVPDDIDFYLRRLGRLIDDFAKSYIRVVMGGDNDEVSAGFFLPPLDDTEYSLPNSMGFRRVLAGAIIQYGSLYTSFSITSDYDHFTARFFETWEEENIMELEYDPSGASGVYVISDEELIELLEAFGPDRDFTITCLSDRMEKSLKSPLALNSPLRDAYTAESTVWFGDAKCSIMLDLRSSGYFEDTIFVPQIVIDGRLVGLPLEEGLTGPEDDGDNFALGQVIGEHLHKLYQSEGNFVDFHTKKSLPKSAIH